jgi:hypothetical protein
METDLVNLLAPYLPQLLAVGGPVAVAAAGEFTGNAAWELAQRVWARVRSHSKGRPALIEAARDFADRPEDERARGAFELQVEKLLAEVGELRGELGPMLEEGRRVGIEVSSTRDVRADRGGLAAGRDIVATRIQTRGRGTRRPRR